MKTGVIIVLSSLIVLLAVALAVTTMDKNKRIGDLSNQLTEKNDQIEELKNEKDELTSKLSNLENENNSLQKEAELNSTYQSNLNSQYPNSSYSPPSMAGATVVYKRSGCDYFILESMKGYVVAEWMGGHDPDEGETLYGSFNSYGTKSFVNSNDEESRLWIEDYWLSREDAFEKLSDECN